MPCERLLSTPARRGRHFYGTPLRWIEIGEDLIIVEPAELGPELHLEVAFGKRGMYRRSRRLWHWR
jgi:hypothetical protein